MPELISREEVRRDCVARMMEFGFERPAATEIADLSLHALDQAFLRIEQVTLSADGGIAQLATGWLTMLLVKARASMMQDEFLGLAEEIGRDLAPEIAERAGQ